MKPGYWPELEKMFQTVRDAGYTPIPERTELVVTGKVVRVNDRLALELDRMRQPVTLPVVASKESPETAEHLERHLGQTVEAEGLWQPPRSGETGPGALAVTAIRAVRPDPKR